jgi:hypothetical protein
MQAPQEFPPDVCSMYAGVGAAGHARSRSPRLQVGASSPGVAAYPTPERGIPAGGRSRLGCELFRAHCPCLGQPTTGNQVPQPRSGRTRRSRALGRQESRHEILGPAANFASPCPMPSPRSQAPMGWENRLSQTPIGYNTVWSRLAINRKTSARIPGRLRPRRVGWRGPDGTR